MTKHQKTDELYIFHIPADLELPLVYKAIKPDLDSMRSLVGGGWIEVVRTPRAPQLHCQCSSVMVVDEEGIIKNLPLNPRACALYPWNPITGDAFLVGEGFVESTPGHYELDFFSLPPSFNSYRGQPNVTL